MSAEAFSKLSIGGQMVTTRAGAARAHTAPLEPPSSPSDDSTPSPKVVESLSSNIKYNVAVLDDEARRRAELALSDNAIGVKYCTQTGEQPHRYIFHIQDDITIAIGGNSIRPKCNCGANDGNLACKHIFWIEDHLSSMAPFKDEVVELTDDGSTVQNIQPAKLLDRMSIESVAEKWDWIFHGGPEVDPEDAEDELNNLLSVFEPSGAFPAEFKSIAESLLLTQRSRKYREMSNVITKYASEDPGFFLSLQAVIDPNFQAHAFFDKINDRVARTFRALDEYIKHGPTDAPTESCDVVTCAAKLRELVQITDEKYQQQMEDDPGSKDIAVRAAACLISILDGVTNRNYDAYINITWGGMAPMDPAQNNLFHCLIKTTNGNGDLFVLDALRDFPQDDVLRHHWEILSNIGEKLQEHGAPPRYLATFQSIITSERRKRATSDVGGSSSKRPMKSLK